MWLLKNKLLENNFFSICRFNHYFWRKHVFVHSSANSHFVLFYIVEFFCNIWRFSFCVKRGLDIDVLFLHLFYNSVAFAVWTARDLWTKYIVVRGSRSKIISVSVEVFIILCLGREAVSVTYVAENQLSDPIL